MFINVLQYFIKLKLVQAVAFDRNIAKIFFIQQIAEAYMKFK